MHQHGNAVRHVVGVVGRRKPAEVHPPPPDREEDERVPDQYLSGSPTDEAALEARPGLGYGHHERQVEEQLQRGRRPVFLMRVSGRHADVKRHALIIADGPSAAFTARAETARRL